MADILRIDDFRDDADRFGPKEDLFQEDRASNPVTLNELAGILGTTCIARIGTSTERPQLYVPPERQR